MTFFISRYFQPYKKVISQKCKLSNSSNMIAIAKALKMSSSINDFEDCLKKINEPKIEQNSDPKPI